MRRLTLVVILLLAVNQSASAAEPVKLRIAMYRGNAPWAVVAAFYEEFTKEYPHIELELTNVYGNQMDRLTVEMVGGVAADVFATWDETTVLSMQRGFTMDLMPLLERDGLVGELADLLPASLELMTMDGGLYGLPQYQAVGAIYYNRDMFEQAGIPDPDGSWDWDEFASVVQKLSRSDGAQAVTTGFTQFPQWIFFFPWFEQGGVRFDDPRTLPLNTPEAVQTVNFVKDLYDRGFIAWDWNAPFLERRSAMMHSGAWELTFLVRSGIRLGVTAPPTGPGGKSTLANSDVVSINRYTKHPEEAWTFIKWLYRPDVQRKYQQIKGLQPARLSLVPYWIDDVQELYRSYGMPPIHGMEAFMTNSAFARPQPFFADPSVITQDINPALHMIFGQNAPPASVLTLLVEEANRKLQAAP